MAARGASRHVVAGGKEMSLDLAVFALGVLVTLLVPQGMAYAELAGLPAITGLYTTVICLVAYALVGPSPILVLGPDSSLGPMIAATILPLAAGSQEMAIALAGMLASRSAWLAAGRRSQPQAPGDSGYGCEQAPALDPVEETEESEHEQQGTDEA